jgi:hypothetical protein
MYLSLIGIGSLMGKNGDERKVLTIAGLAVVVFGYLQYFFYYDLKYLYYLGWDNHLYRLFSSFLDPNFTGMFFSLFFLFLFSKVLNSKFKKSYKELFASFFTIIALYLTYSRTALVALLAGIVSITLFKGKLPVLLLSMVAFFILLTTVSDTSIEGLNPFRTASTIERMISMKEALVISFDDPIIGSGFNAYRYAMLRHGFRNSRGAAVSNADAGTDNSFLFVTATTGIIGFVFFSLSYYFLLKKLFQERIGITIIPFCIVLSFLVGSFFLNALFYTPILIFVFTVISLRKNLFRM